MTKFQTNRVVEINFRGFHEVSVPDGTPVVPIDCGDGIHYAVDPRLVNTTSPCGKGTIWDHDTTYYYIFIPNDAVKPIARDLMA